MTKLTADSEITELLLAWRNGEPEALDRLAPLVLDELRKIATSRLRSERDDHTLQPTALVNEVFIQLIDKQRVHWKNRVHFFAVAAKMMRHILVDHARSLGTQKRGGGVLTISIEDAHKLGRERGIDLIALDLALDKLELMDKRQAQVVEMRFFAGLEVKEVAAELSISATQVKRDWRTAKLWLIRELTDTSPSKT